MTSRGYWFGPCAERRIPESMEKRKQETPPGGDPGGALVRSYLAHIRLRGARILIVQR